MYQICDYIRWRGDVPFSEAPFNNVDGYILAKAGMPDLTGLITEEGPVLLSEAIKRYTAVHGEEASFGALASRGLLPMLKSLGGTKRFGNVKVLKFVKILDKEQTEQLSALTLLLPDGTAYVTFRGTDDTLLAWRENMYLASEQVVAAQRDADEYLDMIARVFPGPLRIGGHSKGGNLAVYAASRAENTVQDRILEVYSFDGPGFRSAFLDDPGYERILPKVHAVLPEHSMVGTLLYRKEKPEIVACSKMGIPAHDGLCWSALPEGFERVNDLQPFSEIYMRAMRRTLIPMSAEQRRAFTDALFDILTESGAETVSDITAQGLMRNAGLVYSIVQDPETRKFVTEFLENMIAELTGTGAASEPKGLRGMILGGVGRVIRK